MVRPNYLTMTDAEFEAYLEARDRQFTRVHHRSLLYGAFMLLPAVVVLCFVGTVADVPLWAVALLGGGEGLAASKLARWLAQRREEDL